MQLEVTIQIGLNLQFLLSCFLDDTAEMASFLSPLLSIWLVLSAALPADALSARCTTNDCIVASDQVLAAAHLQKMRGMLAIEGTTRRCFLGLEAGGHVRVQDWCQTALPGLSRVRSWRWQPSGLWLLDEAGAPVFTLAKDPHSNVFRQVLPDGSTLLFYPFAAEATPH